MPNFAERLARRTRNTFAPAQRIFQKVTTQAPTFFKKVVSGGQTFFNKTLPGIGSKIAGVGNQIAGGLDKAGNVIGSIASNPLVGALGAAVPELMPFIAGAQGLKSSLQKASQGVSKASNLANQASNIGANLSSDPTTAGNQILQRVKPIVEDANQVSFV